MEDQRRNKQKTPRPPSSLTRLELDAALGEYPPVLDVHQASRLLRQAPSTTYHQVSRGMYRDAVRRGRPLRFWRDRLIRAFFRG